MFTGDSNYLVLSSSLPATEELRRRAVLFKVKRHHSAEGEILQINSYGLLGAHLPKTMDWFEEEKGKLRMQDPLRLVLFGD